MLLRVLNRKEELLTIIHNDGETDGIFDLHMVEDIAEISTLTFSVSGNTDGIEHLIDGNYILTQNRAEKWKLFVIKQVDDSHGDSISKKVYCEDIISELGDVNTGVNLSGKEIVLATEFRNLLAGTQFVAGKVDSTITKVTLEQDTRYISKLNTLQLLSTTVAISIFVEITISEDGSLVKTISLRESNAFKGKRFEFDSDLTSIDRTTDTTAIKTAIIGLGKQIPQTAEEQEAGKPVEYVTFKDVAWSTANGDPLYKPKGSDTLEDPKATAKYGIKQADGTLAPKVIVLHFSDIEDPKELIVATYAQLLKLSQPKTTFTFTANALATQMEEQGESEMSVETGDVCYVIDDSVIPAIVEEVVVRRMEGNPDDPASMIVEIGNPLETLVDEDVSTMIATAIASSGSVNGAFGEITAIKAEINYLKANKAEITDLEAVRIQTETIEAKVADINTIVSGNITSDNIHSSGITSDKLVIRDGFITNAMIQNVNADKINAGSINTNKVHIESENGGIVIADNTQQFKDKDGKVRIQMGQDATGEFSFGIFDEAGTGVLIDHTGVKEQAIADGLIKNEMIGNGQIAGEKINISSMITSINNGTSTIKGSKVYLDTEKQTLEVGFNNLKTTTTEHSETIESHTTSLNVQAGKIDTLISDTTIVKDGQELKLKDEYSKLEQTVGNIETTVGSHETKWLENEKVVESLQTKIQQNTDGIAMSATKAEVSESIDTVTGEITKLDTRVKSAEQKITPEAITATVENTSTTLATKSEVQQTADAVTFKFNELNGENLLYNTTFKNGIKHFSVGSNNPVGDTTGATTAIVNSDWTANKEAIQIAVPRTLTGGWIGAWQDFDTVVGQTYTVSCLVAGHRCTGGISVSGTNGTGGLGSKNFDTSKTGGADIKNWDRITFSFTAQNTKQRVYMLLRTTAPSDGFIWFRELIITKGGATPAWSPNPNELVNGSTEIDSSGVTVNNGALTIKNKSSEVVFNSDSNGNMIARRLTIQRADGVVVMDSGNFRFDFGAEGAEPPFTESPIVIDQAFWKLAGANGGSGTYRACQYYTMKHVGRYLKCTFIKGVGIDGSGANFQLRRPDGTILVNHYFNNLTIDNANNTVTLTVDIGTPTFGTFTFYVDMRVSSSSNQAFLRKLRIWQEG